MRRGIAALVALLAVVGVVAAAQAKPKATTTITLAGWSAGADEDNLLQQVVNTFMKTHPSIKVDYTVINGDYPTAMTSRFAAHNPPDVFYVDSSLAPTWSQQGVLQPLNAYISASKYDTQQVLSGLLNAFKTGKTVYGFPKDWSPLAMEINTGMLGSARQKAPKTWAELTAAAAEDQGCRRRLRRRADLPRRRTGRGCWRSSSRTRRRSPRSPRRRPSRPSTTTSACSRRGSQRHRPSSASGWCGEALGKQKAAIIFEGNWVLPYMKSTRSRRRVTASSR